MNEENFCVVENHASMTQGAGGPHMSDACGAHLQALFDEMCTMWYLHEDLHAIPPGDSELTPFSGTKGTLEYWLEQLSPIPAVQNHYAPYLENLRDQWYVIVGTPAGNELAQQLDNAVDFIRAASMYNAVLCELWFE